MSRFRSHMSIVAIASAVLVMPGVIAAQAPAKVDLTGKWQFSVTTSAGAGTPTVTFRQLGDSLTGHYSSQVLGEAELKGTVTNGKFGFTFPAEVQGASLVVKYNGTVESKDELKGTVDLGGQATGTFTAKRQ